MARNTAGPPGGIVDVARLADAELESMIAEQLAVIEKGPSSLGGRLLDKK